MSWCETEMQKYMPLVKQNVEVEDKELIRKEIRDGGEGVERIEMEAQKVTELTIEEEDKEHLHLPLLVSSRCVSSEFPTRFQCLQPWLGDFSILLPFFSIFMDFSVFFYIFEFLTPTVQGGRWSKFVCLQKGLFFLLFF